MTTQQLIRYKEDLYDIADVFIDAATQKNCSKKNRKIFYTVHDQVFDIIKFIEKTFLMNLN